MKYFSSIIAYGFLSIACALALVPVHAALADVTTTDAPASPKAGMQIFQTSAHEPGIWGNSAFLNAITTDIRAVYGGGEPALPSKPSSSDVSASGIWAGKPDNTDGGHHVTGGQQTVDRLCQDIDSTMGANPSGKATSYSGDDYSSTGGQEIVLFDGSKWWREDAAGSSNRHLISLVCDSYALPSQTLSAASYALTVGQSTTLRWADTTPRDALAGQAGKKTGDGIPFTSCTTTGFSIPQTTESYCRDWEPNENWGQSGSYCAEYGHYSVPASTSGTVTVSPTQTTTYTYSCTNPNGTHTLSATITVAQAPVVASCSASPTSVQTGQNVLWAATASGGTAPYTYSWSGSEGLSGSAVTTSKSYSSTGTKTAVVQVVSADGQSKTVNCDNSVSVTSAPVLKADYVASEPALASGGTVGESATFSTSVTNQGNASGGATSAVRFQIDYGANGSYDANLDTANTAIPSLAVGGHASATSPASIDLPAGQYNVRACADLPGNRVSESNEGNNCGPDYSFTVAPDANSITVSCGTAVVGLPDLTAGAVTPTVTTATVPTQFSATISNIGDIATGIGFTDLLQEASDANGTGAADVGTVQNSPLGQSGTSVASFSYTFPASDAGATRYLRVCADKSSSSDLGDIDESDSDNNCSSPWTPIQVNGGSVSCVASPSNATAGQTVTYTAFPSGTARAPYSWVSSDGATGLPTTATITHTYSNPGTYSMTVTPTGVATTPGICGPLVTVTGCAGTPTPTITATPVRVPKGQNALITWGATNVSGSCTVTGTDGFSQTFSAAGNSCGIPDGHANPPIDKATTYCISCASGGPKQCVTVNILGTFEEQ